jgi:CRISPR-associated endonuclease/helicase Cas3
MLDTPTGRLSAKFDRGGSGAYHPLICHLLDVAAVARVLWERGLGDGSRTLLRDGLGLPGDDETMRWVAFLAGAHDLGKASPRFQSMDPGARGRLPGLGIPASPQPQASAHHGVVTAAFLPPLLEGRGVDAGLARRLAAVTGGHHGLFAPGDAGQQLRKARDIELHEAGRRAEWDAIRAELVEALAEACGLGGAVPTQLTNAAALALAGFVTTADWIGSMSGGPGQRCYFAYAPDGPDNLAAYWAKARQQAETAIDGEHWRLPMATGTPSIRALFRGIDSLRPLQKVTEAEVAPEADCPGLVVIEAPMGEGKTEAAIHILDGWAAKAGLRGAYVAMPTMATSNQMYDRFLRYVEARFAGADIDVPVMLAHGHASLREGLQRLDDVTVPRATYDEEDGQAHAGIADWFTYRKRGLLAPYGVGTVDQALMGVLQVRHNFVRLFGLAGKAVLIDEVHAYDTYMTTLLERLLEWLAALGSPVVLLSATLPAGRREALMAAYLRGLGAKVALPALAARYPRVTWLAGGHVRERHIEATDRARTLHLDAIGPDVEDIARVLQERLAGGGCAAVICNTVRGAQETFTRLRDLLPEWAGAISLFHARFLYEDRARIETEVLDRFGPPWKCDRPERAILVATQVIEQSLDVDFDVMISDPAPLDLLLQRSGRLQRHDGHPRPAGETPTLHIRWAPGHDVAPSFDECTKAVYAEYVLLRTWDALRGRGSIEIPGNVQELVDHVYADPSTSEVERTPDGVDDEAWARALAELRSDLRVDQDEAKGVRIAAPGADKALHTYTARQLREDDAEVHLVFQARTRKTGPTVSVVLLQHDDPAITATSEPDRDETKRLLTRSLSVSAVGLVHDLRALPVPQHWQRNAWLRDHRLLVLGPEGRVAADAQTLEYSHDIGLREVADGA